VQIQRPWDLDRMAGLDELGNDYFPRLFKLMISPYYGIYRIVSRRNHGCVFLITVIEVKLCKLPTDVFIAIQDQIRIARAYIAMFI
jgi:hypothetical protein